MRPIFPAASQPSLPYHLPDLFATQRGPRMPKQRVAEEKLVKLFVFTRDSGATITATLTSDPVKLKQMAAFQIPYPHCGAL